MKLFKSGNITLSTSVFYDTLSEIINKGDVLYVASDLSSFGALHSSVVRKDLFINEFFSIFKRLVGEDGVLIFPSFSYSWGNTSFEKLYDVRNTSCSTGAMPNFLINNGNLVRTLDPMFSTLIWGNRKKDFANIGKSCFGDNSIFDKIYKSDAKIMNFGTPFFDPTYVHYVEKFFNDNVQKLSYRKNIEFHGRVINKDGDTYNDMCSSFMRHANSRFIFTDKNLITQLTKNNDIFLRKIGNGKIFCAKATDIMNVGIKGLLNDDSFFAYEGQ